MMKVKCKLKSFLLLSNKKTRYLLAGIWNTIFGYTCAIVIYYQFKNLLGAVGTGVVSNILSITMSYAVYKVFVFKTRGAWISEYLRAYLVYGVNSLIGISILWLGVDLIDLQFWLVQGFAIIFVTIITYLGHSRFTFKSFEPNK